jgi:pimeloyl-ACP methyl ester carboxylesterase
MKLLSTNHQQAEPAKDATVSPLPEMVEDGKGGLMIARAKESFSNLTLEGSELTAQEPVFGSREEKPTFIRELWQLRWRPNDPIDLYIILPRNAAAKPPAVLYLYGFPSETDRFKDDRFCERVTRGGVAAIGFVSALTGHRYTNRPFKNWFVSELPESLASTVHDVQMILNQLKTREDLDLDRIGMFGQGSGATIAILAAAVDPRIKALDLLDPWGDWPEWFATSDSFPEQERVSYSTPEFQKSLEPLEPLKYLPALQDRGLRIQFVKENREPEPAVKKLEAAAPANAEIHHFATGRDMFAVYSDGRIFSWMATQLHASPAAAQQAGANPAKPPSP